MIFKLQLHHSSLFLLFCQVSKYLQDNGFIEQVSSSGSPFDSSSSSQQSSPSATKKVRDSQIIFRNLKIKCAGSGQYLQVLLLF